MYYTILYYTILYYTILYYTILYYTILYYTILYYTILYYTILYCTILYYTILYYTIRCYAIHYTLYTIHCTLYTIYYSQYIIYYMLYTTYYILYTIIYYTLLYSGAQNPTSGPSLPQLRTLKAPLVMAASALSGLTSSDIGPAREPTSGLLVKDVHGNSIYQGRYRPPVVALSLPLRAPSKGYLGHPGSLGGSGHPGRAADLRPGRAAGLRHSRPDRSRQLTLRTQ